jgi:CHAT domain-containing protein
MPKHVILFLAANPDGTNPLKLGEECAEIQRELKMTPHRDDFHFESRWAVSIDELMRHLTELDPTVIHFSGHGDRSAGLLLQDEQGQPQPVSARALAMMVEAAARSVRVVVLNACYTTVQADALRAKVDCVVGMSGAIGDVAARAFAIRFYGALGNRRSISNAVAQGIAALAAKQLPDEVLPRCTTRVGVNAEQVVLDPS